MKGFAIGGLVIFLFFISGCAQQSQVDYVKGRCISLCKNYNGDLSNGPCLSDNNPEWDIEDWVCDVAHDPREDVDNLAENQCQDYREGKANHFVEVDPGCNFIRAI
jgi:hypothetical protein